jgi:hypothetical protein
MCRQEKIARGANQGLSYTIYIKIKWKAWTKAKMTMDEIGESFYVILNGLDQITRAGLIMPPAQATNLRHCPPIMPHT